MTERLTCKRYNSDGYTASCSSACRGGDCGDCVEFGKIIDRLADYENTGLTPEEIVKTGMAYEDNKRYSRLLEGRLKAYEEPRLRELAKADREGRVVVLPCKVGGEVYSTLDDLRRLHQCRVTDVFISERPYVNYVSLEPVDYEGSRYGATFGSFGKTVFLTREEAEEALRRVENGN